MPLIDAFDDPTNLSGKRAAFSSDREHRHPDVGVRAGDSGAAGRLFELFHPELKRLAAGHLRKERADHSWQPTLLVNELYLEFVKIKALQPAESERQDDKATFFALAGMIMKRLLIHDAGPLAQSSESAIVG